MINRTSAWQCSDGSCHENKQQAYNAEINYLYGKLPSKGNRQNTAIQFGKLIGEVAEWLDAAVLLQRQMKDETDVDTKRSIAGQGG